MLRKLKNGKKPADADCSQFPLISFAQQLGNNWGFSSFGLDLRMCGTVRDKKWVIPHLMLTFGAEFWQ